MSNWLNFPRIMSILALKVLRSGQTGMIGHSTEMRIKPYEVESAELGHNHREYFLLEGVMLPLKS